MGNKGDEGELNIFSVIEIVWRDHYCISEHAFTRGSTVTTEIS